MIAIKGENSSIARLLSPMVFTEPEYSEEYFVHIWVSSNSHPEGIYQKGLPYLCGVYTIRNRRSVGDGLRLLTKEIWQQSFAGKKRRYESIRSYDEGALIVMLQYLGYKVFTAFDYRVEGDADNELFAYEQWLETQGQLSPFVDWSLQGKLLAA